MPGLDQTATLPLGRSGSLSDPIASQPRQRSTTRIDENSLGLAVSSVSTNYGLRMFERLTLLLLAFDQTF